MALAKEYMTSRQRVQMALSFRQPDRVPIDMGGFQTGIHVKAYQGLIDVLGIEEQIQILDPVQQLARPSEAVLQRLHIDTRYVVAHGPEGFDGQIRRVTRDGRTWYELIDEFGVVWSMPEDQGLYMDITHHPLADASIKDLEDYPFPKGDDPSRFTGCRQQAMLLRDQTEYAICTGIFGVVYEYCWYMRGLESWFVDMIEQPTFCEALLDRMLRFWIDYTTSFMSEVGDLVDVVMIGDDLAGQDGPLFSPQFYRHVVKPRHKALIQHIKSLTKAKVWYHTCGSCLELIPDLIDNGIDILNPVQISAKGMEPKVLKDRFGSRLVFWGGAIDAQHILPYATPQEVRREVCRNLDVFKPGGGYVFANVHNIQAGVPIENIIAMYDAAYEYGRYS